jgi:hypothetical protein
MTSGMFKTSMGAPAARLDWPEGAAVGYGQAWMRTEPATWDRSDVTGVVELPKSTGRVARAAGSNMGRGAKSKDFMGVGDGFWFRR